MKNILIISNYAAPYRGNFIPALETIERHYKKGNLYYLFPSVADIHPWMQDFKKNHNVWLRDRKLFSKHIQWRLLSDLVKLIQECDIHIVHTHFVEGNVNLYLLKLMTKAKFVANLHNHYAVSGRLGFIRKWFFKQTNDIVIGDSKSVSESAYAIGIQQNKVITILNCIQFSRFDNSIPIEIKSKGCKVVLMFGYPWYRKGVDVVVKALQTLNALEDKFLLAIAQSGGVEQTKDGICQAIGSLPDWIIFLPPTDKLADYYNAADIFISAGREEGLSYSPIEAAYCRPDVICSNIGGNPLDIPEIGIYETEDINALIHCIQACIESSADGKKIRKHIQREYVLKHYNVEDWAEEIIKCY